VSASVTTAPASLPERILAGDPQAVARAISLVEDEAPASASLMEQLHGHTGHACLVGITGPPGAGKSTLVDRLVTHLRVKGLTVGVLAVDPSSPFTGGALLGDRVRMVGHACDAGVFVRSMATRGHVGGLARATSDAAAILDASGKDLVIIETVGVGQDEVDVVRTADVSIVVLVPDTGDDVQALKAGIMEIADVFVVNKADRDGADRLVQSVAANQSLRTVGPDEWQPPIVKTEAISGGGVAALWAAVERFRTWSGEHGRDRHRDRQAWRVRQALREAAARHVERALAPGAFDQAVSRVTAREIDARSAAAELVRQVLVG
jgi:LAO/AO transport system kinase